VRCLISQSSIISEVKKWINSLAELYLKEGVKPGKISRKIAEVTGYVPDYIQDLLEDKYKMRTRPKGKKEINSFSRSTSEQPSIVLEAKEKLGEKKLETLKKVIIEEEKPKIKEEVKREVLEEITETEQTESSSETLRKLGIPPVEKQVEDHYKTTSRNLQEEAVYRVFFSVHIWNSLTDFSGRSVLTVTGNPNLL